MTVRRGAFAWDASPSRTAASSAAWARNAHPHHRTTTAETVIVCPALGHRDPSLVSELRFAHPRDEV